MEQENTNPKRQIDVLRGIVATGCNSSVYICWRGWSKRMLCCSLTVLLVEAFAYIWQFTYDP